MFKWRTKSEEWKIRYSCGLLLFHFSFNRLCNRINKTNVPVATRQMCRLICNLPEFNIRIFNPLASYFYFRYEFLIKKIAIKVWISDHRSWCLMLSDSISDRTIALLILDIFVVSFGYNQLTLHFDSYCCFLTFYRYKTNAPLVQLIWTNKANVPADL